jgi:polyvinyl alcohol dehydrogenase (cytochrome)
MATLCAALMGAAGLYTGAARAAEQQAYAVGLNYATPAVVVGQGDTLRFNNLDPVANHNIVSDDGKFTSALIGQGKSELVTGVDKLAPGTYAFHCQLHAWMHGELEVTAASAGPSPGPPPAPTSPGSSPDPATLTPRAPVAPLGKGEWPLYGHDLSNSRNAGAAGPSLTDAINLGPVWSFQSTQGDFTGTPVEAANTVVAGSNGGTVFALNATTGAKRWARKVAGPVNGTVAISGTRVFVPVATPNAPRITALDLRTGAVLWSTIVDRQKDSDVYGSPTVAGGRVFMGTSALFGELNDPKVAVRGSVVALDPVTGRMLWKTFTVPPRHDGGAVWTTPAVADGRVYVGTGNAYHAPAAPNTDSLLALDATTGRIVAHFQATAGDVWNATSNVGAGPDADFGASPNLFTGPNKRAMLGAGQKSGTYWAVDRATLKPLWNLTVGAGSQVGGILGSTAVDGQRIYGPNTPAGEVWAAGFGGQLSWVSSDVGPIHWNPASVANGVVYSTDISGFLTAREASTGLVVAKLPLGSPAFGGVSIAGGSVFAVTGTQGDSGWIVAYRPR